MMKARILFLAVLMAILGANLGWAQSPDQVMRVNVPFDFTVGNKVLPAGQYDFARVALNNALSVRSADGGASADAIVVSRLWSGIHESPNDSHIVFDQVGGKHIFVQLWIPGADGYLLAVTKEPHDYKAINIGD